MTSLFMNNRDIEKITVYLVLDNVSERNKERYIKLADEYKREVVLIDAASVVERVKAYNIPMWRDSYATNFRLFFPEYIRPDVTKLLYLDCDTLVVSSLKPLLEIDMGDNCIGMAICSIMTRKERSTLYASTEKHNAGIMLINIGNWENGRWTDKLIYHIENVRARYPAPDQDLLNIVCAGHILKLPQEYNFPSIHRVYSDDTYFKAMKQTQVSEEDIAYARQHPAIYHIYRFLGQHPWHRDTLHPDRELFDQYLEKSLWNDYEKKPSPSNLVFRIERALYKILPKGMFFRLFLVASEIAYCRQNNRLVKEEAESRALK